MSVFTPNALPQLVSSVADLAPLYGTKGAFLTALPPAWTPEFILLSTELVDSLAIGAASLPALPRSLRGVPIIVRSSIVGETIWDRGTFLTIPFERSPDVEAISQAIIRIRAHALDHKPGARIAIILQRYLPDCEKGTLGNLNQLSKTREQWARFVDVGGLTSAPERFNSQRDAPADPRAPLVINPQMPLDRLYGSACRWLLDHFGQMLGRDRMLLEWASADGQIYLLQCDMDEDNPDGVDPAEQLIATRLTFPAAPPVLLREPQAEDIAHWDKLKVLEELSTDYAPLPQKLYLLTYAEAAQALASEDQQSILRADFSATFGELAVIRVSRRTGADKTTGLPCTSKCLDAHAALAWIAEELAKFTAKGGQFADRAFIIHRYIGARAGAWALYDPASPYIQVHANWGLPDALQFYPYDAWDVHAITEEITAYPSYKSHFLWPGADGEWTFKQIRNSIGRHQCLKSNEVLEIARKTSAIGTKLGKRVAVMWFAGVETETGGRFCLPWYRTLEYSTPDLEAALSRDHVTVVVRNPDDLIRAKEIADTLAAPLKLALDIQPSEYLVREPKFLTEIIDLAKSVDASVIYSGSPLAHAYFQLQGHVTVFLRLHRKSFRTRSRIKYHKLVRDGIPERISAKHERVVYANLRQEQILQLLTGKLIEEAQELISAEGQDATAEELADVYEVLRGMMHQAGVDEDRVVEIANSKRARVGGFDRGVFLLETSLPKPGESTVETRDVNFDDLIGEEYGRGTVKVPFALLGRLAISGERLFRIPGSDKAIRFSPGRDGFELSLEQQEQQLEFAFASGDEDEDEDSE
jgi:predicted house-cleaning noncanonical NTP pyrophosphatase (MazG superfamily)